MNEGEPRSAVRWAAVIGGILIAAAIIALYTPWVRIFDLREIVVSGNHYTSAAEIRDATGIQDGVNIVRASLRQARTSLLHLPWVMDASLRRVLPHTIAIRVRERKPIAFVLDSHSERLMILGEDGVIVGYTKDEGADYVRVRGVSLSRTASGRQTVSEDVMRTLNYLRDRGLGRDIFPSIDFSDPAAITMHTADDGEVLLGPLSETKDRIDELVALLDTIDLAAYKTIDLRFGGEARLVPRKVVNR